MNPNMDIICHLFRPITLLGKVHHDLFGYLGVVVHEGVATALKKVVCNWGALLSQHIDDRVHVFLDNLKWRLHKSFTTSFDLYLALDVSLTQSLDSNVSAFVVEHDQEELFDERAKLLVGFLIFFWSNVVSIVR